MLKFLLKSSRNGVLKSVGYYNNNKREVYGNFMAETAISPEWFFTNGKMNGIWNIITTMKK